MKIIFSPSKEMRTENIFRDSNISSGFIFEKKTEELLKILKSFSKEKLATVMKIKDKILENTYNNIQNYENLNSMPALSLYNGVAYKELELNLYSKESFDYIKDRLFILSAFYGLSKSFSLIKNYRLDMTMRISDFSLYNFWKEELNNYIEKELRENKDSILINLASNEFSKLLDRKKIKNIINIDFKDVKDEKYISISSYSKQARGAFLNILIKNRITDIEALKHISFDRYKLNLELSDNMNFIYTR